MGVLFTATISVLMVLVAAILVFSILLYFQRSTNSVIEPTASGGGGSADNPANERSGEVFSVIDSKGAEVASDTFQDVMFTNVNLSTSACFGYEEGKIVIRCPGMYEIAYKVQVEAKNEDRKGGQFATVLSHALLDDNVITGSESSCSLKKQANNFSCACVATAVVLVGAAERTVRVQFARSTGTTGCETKPDQSYCVVKKL